VHTIGPLDGEHGDEGGGNVLIVTYSVPVFRGEGGGRNLLAS
jgi:hypothetical protein